MTIKKIEDDMCDHINPMEKNDKAFSNITLNKHDINDFPYICKVCHSTNTKQGLKKDIGVCLDCGRWFSTSAPIIEKKKTNIEKLVDRYDRLQHQLSFLDKVAKKIGVDLNE